MSRSQDPKRAGLALFFVLLALSSLIVLLVASLRRQGGAAQSIARAEHHVRAISLRIQGESLALDG